MPLLSEIADPWQREMLSRDTVPLDIMNISRPGCPSRTTTCFLRAGVARSNRQSSVTTVVSAHTSPERSTGHIYTYIYIQRLRFTLRYRGWNGVSLTQPKEQWHGRNNRAVHISHQLVAHHSWKVIDNFELVHDHLIWIQVLVVRDQFHPNAPGKTLGFAELFDLAQFHLVRLACHGIPCKDCAPGASHSSLDTQTAFEYH